MAFALAAPRTLTMLGALLLASACVAPVQWQRVPHEPSRYTYVGAHGVPLAFGGEVCAIRGRHTHGYPPVPAAAFVLEDGAARDTRTLYAYVDPHPHYGRTCFRERWHLHLEPPAEGLRFDETLNAYVASADAKRASDDTSQGHSPEGSGKPAAKTSPERRGP